jgi:hypothetical protein
MQMREDVQEMETEVPDLIHELKNTDQQRVPMSKVI